MSDLDADIYGDLYGNSEVPPQSSDEAEQEQPNEKQATSSSGTKTTTTKASAESAKPSISVPVTTTTTTATTLQPIQTYEEEHDTGAPTRSFQTGVRPSDMNEDGKMFIGGLHWDTTDEGLEQYFSQFGVVDACSIMRDPAGRSRCFAFLTFRDSESVDNVVAQHEHLLDGKIIDPKRAIPRNEHQRATKLFIGGLPATCTSESMREFFSQFGRVVESTVMLDQTTGRSKGFGFISLENTDVTPFLGFGNLEIDGKLIDVKLAQPRYQREQNEQAGGSNVNFQNNAARGGGGNFNPGANFGGPGAQAFDPQALANLYTRMFQMASGAGGNMGMMNGMTGAGMNMFGNPAMRGGMGGAGMGVGMGMGMGGGMGRGGIPKGPRGGAPSTQGGPQRAGRGQHGYHPYSR